MATELDIDLKIQNLEEERARKISAIEAKFDLDIAALKRTKEIFALDDFGFDQSDQEYGSQPRRERFPKWPGVRPAIRGFIERAKENFTLDDVEKALRFYEDRPEIARITISTELWKMANHDPKTIVLVKKGRPNIYGRKD